MTSKEYHQSRFCKVCGEFTDNGTNFCSRKHRIQWVREHNYTKNDWKRTERRRELMMIRMSGGKDQGNAGDHRLDY